MAPKVMVHFLFMLCTAAKAKTLSILPLGDSITYGCGDNCTSRCSPLLPCVDCLINTSYTPCARCSSGYRLALYELLIEGSKDVDPIFVGPFSNGHINAPPDAISHAGWPGIRISGEATVNHTTGLIQIVKQWSDFAIRADAILLHIGTNNVLQNGYASSSEAAADMGGQLAELLGVIGTVTKHRAS